MRRLPVLSLLLLAGCLRPVELPAPEVAIDPANPDDGDALSLVLDDLGDNPAALEWSIEWRLKGAVQDDLDDALVVPAARTTAGDTWTVAVALALGGGLGPAGEASVTIGGGGDDDDSGVDDDDSGGDDDVSPDDDDTVEHPGVGSRLCAAAGASRNEQYTLTNCTGPVETAPGVMTNGTWTIRIDALGVGGQ